MRRRDAARPSYTQSSPVANSVEVYLDSSGSAACWVIERDEGPLYRMLPNPADPEYSSFPNFDGCWDVAVGVQGAYSATLCFLSVTRVMSRSRSGGTASHVAHF
jgi:hypothetical protein